MKKILTVALLLGVMSLYGFSQDGKPTRPRVVVETTPTPPDNSEETPSPTPSSTPFEDDEEINIETNLVTLPVSVLDEKGRFISNLRQQDFEIFENGVQQSVDYFASVESPFTVILLLDVSPSTRYKIDEIQDAAISFVDQLRKDDKLIVASFSEEFKILSTQNTNMPAVKSAIRQTKFGKGTSIYEAMDYAMSNLLKGITGRKAIVVLSDGVDTSSLRTNYARTVKQAEKIDSLIYAVRYNTFEDNQVVDARQYSLGASPKEYRRGRSYLTELTTVSGGRLYEAETTQNIQQAFKNIADELRQQYALGYYPEVDGKDGERRNIKIRVKLGNMIVKSKESYTFSNSISKR